MMNDVPRSKEDETRLSQLEAETQALCRSVRERIKSLEYTPIENDAPMWKNWVRFLGCMELLLSAETTTPDHSYTFEVPRSCSELQEGRRRV
jgi:hypothetical protein